MSRKTPFVQSACAVSTDKLIGPGWGPTGKRKHGLVYHFRVLRWNKSQCQALVSAGKKNVWEDCDFEIVARRKETPMV